MDVEAEVDILFELHGQEEIVKGKIILCTINTS